MDLGLICNVMGIINRMNIITSSNREYVYLSKIVKVSLNVNVFILISFIFC